MLPRFAWLWGFEAVIEKLMVPSAGTQIIKKRFFPHEASAGYFCDSWESCFHNALAAWLVGSSLSAC
jgi:hypothetical protein